IATTGFGRRRIWMCRSVTWKRPTAPPCCAEAASSSRYPESPRTRWSPPEQNASSPSPVRMMAPIAGSSRASSNARESSITVLGRKAVALPAGLAFAQALHACLLLGAVAVPVDVRAPARERERVASDAAVVVEEPLSQRPRSRPQASAATHDLDAVALLIHTSGTT